MEIIIAIIAVLAIAIVLYSRKPKELVEAEQAEVAPYKVDTPVVATPVAEVTPEAVVEAPAKKPRAPRKPKAVAAKKPAAKKVAAKASAKKPAAVKAKSKKA